MRKRNFEEDYDSKIKRSSIIKRIGICILVALAIIVIFLMLKKCDKAETDKDLNTLLLDSAKEYYQYNKHLLPTLKGECTSVTLEKLANDALIDDDKFDSCSDSLTYVKVCKLESGKLHYVAFLDCEQEVTDIMYGDWFEGAESDIIADSSDIKFLYQVEYLEVDDSNLADVEEYWQDEIPYEKYKTESITKYYRYKDLQYIWNIINKKYYPSNEALSKDVKEYYVSSPSSEYILRDSKNDSVSKYYKLNIEKEYWVNEQGTKQAAQSAPDNKYIYPDNPISQTRYRTRTWSHNSNPTTASPTQMWFCSSENDSNWITSYVPCSENPNQGYDNIEKMIYTCDNGLTEVGQNGTCYRCPEGKLLRNNNSCGNYGNWGNYTTTVCDISSDLCDSLTLTLYNWYKENEIKTYYPSNSIVASNEKTYYSTAPTSGLIKDESTTTTGWKWYKTTTTQTTDYYTVSPSDGATKTSNSRWTEFTNWSVKSPSDLGNSGTRTIESKNKVKLRQILEEIDTWKKINEEYIELKDLLDILKEKGYNVNSLEEINASGELRYNIKLYIRNKEEKLK